MRWDIWWRKALLGLVTTMAASGVAYLVATTQGLMEDPSVSPWLVMVGPVALHGLGLLANMIKHWNN